MPTTSTSQILRDNKELILREWEEEVRKVLPAALHESKTSLRDSLPDFLDDLIIALEHGLSPVRKEILRVAHKHGAERANLSDYTIEEALEEFNILRKIIFKALEISHQVPSIERDIIYDVINYGFAIAGTEFAKAQLREKALAEAALSRAASKLQNITDIQPTLIGLIGTDYRYKFINRTYEEWFDVKRENLIGRTIQDVLGMDFWEKVHEHMDRCLKGEEVRFEAEIVVGGRKRFLKFLYQPEVNENNKITGAYVTVSDLTDQQNAIVELEKRELEFRALTNAIPQIAWMSDTEGSIYWFNERWYEFTGATKEESLGWAWQDYQREEYIREKEVPYVEAIMKGNPWEDTFELRGKHGDWRWFLSRALPVKNNSGKIVKWIGTLTDVTEQKKITDELHREQFMRDKLISTLSHDLRTPLTAAKMAGQLIKRKPLDQVNSENQAARIIKNIDRADKMIQDLLDANRIKAGKLIEPAVTELNLKELLESILVELSTIYGDRFELNGDENLQVNSWPMGITRIVENLCSNAIKYGAADTPVAVDTGSDDKCFSISVHNFGHPVEDEASLFDQFKRTSSAEKSATKGWGIGLTVVKGIAEGLGGSVKVSRHKDGTTFTVILPLDSRPRKDSDAES